MASGSPKRGFDPLALIASCTEEWNGDVAVLMAALEESEIAVMDDRRRARNETWNMKAVADEIMGMEQDASMSAGFSRQHKEEAIAKQEGQLRVMHSRHAKFMAALGKKEQELDQCVVLSTGLQGLKERLVGELKRSWKAITVELREAEADGDSSAIAREEFMGLVRRCRSRWADAFRKTTWKAVYKPKADAGVPQVTSVTAKGGNGGSGNGGAGNGGARRAGPSARTGRGRSTARAGGKRPATPSASSVSLVASRPQSAPGTRTPRTPRGGAGGSPGVLGTPAKSPRRTVNVTSGAVPVYLTPSHSGSPAQRARMTQLNEIDTLMGAELKRPHIKKALEYAGLKKPKRVKPGIWLVGSNRLEPYAVNGRVMLKICGGSCTLQEYLHKQGRRESEYVDLQTNHGKDLHYTINKTHDIDEALKAQYRKRAIREILLQLPPLERVSFKDFSFGATSVTQGTYRFGTKTINVQLKSNKLLVGHGGGLIEFGDYVRKYGVLEANKFDVIAQYDDNDVDGGGGGGGGGEYADDFVYDDDEYDEFEQ